MLQIVIIIYAESQIIRQGYVHPVHLRKESLIGEPYADRHILGKRIIHVRSSLERICIKLHVIEYQELVIVKLIILITHRPTEHYMSLGHEYGSLSQPHSPVEFLCG